MVPAPSPVAVSAHRCNDRHALERACRLGGEYVEFDVQRTRDGVFVLHHDPVVGRGRRKLVIADSSFDDLFAVVGDVVTLPEALSMLAHRARAHVDFKFASPDGSAEVQAAATVVEIMGPGAAVITSRRASSVRAVRQWSRIHAADLLVGLSLWPHELRCAAKLRRSDANLLAAHHWLARLLGARTTNRFGMPLLVWTVDDSASLDRWLTSSADIVTTNAAALALARRS